MIPWGIGIGTEKEKLVSLLVTKTEEQNEEKQNVAVEGHILSSGLRHRERGMKQIRRENLR